MLCQKCKSEYSDGYSFCPFCGTKKAAVITQRKKSRGNGQGYIYKRGSKWIGQVTLGYVPGADGIYRRKTRSKTFATKKEALLGIPTLKNGVKKVDSGIKFYELYDDFVAGHELTVSKSTMDCYKSAYKHFSRLWYEPFADLVTEHYQSCIDGCGHGTRTQENMKALISLLYKEAGKKGLALTDFSKYLAVDRKNDDNKAVKDAFTAAELNKIAQNSDKSLINSYIYILCLTGYRINEFLSRQKSDLHCQVDADRLTYYITGGNKTAAGKNKIVTISPKIENIVLNCAKNLDDSGYLFGIGGKPYPIKRFRADFCAALAGMGVRELNPHCTRHTFATLLKNIKAPDTDKAALIGHTDIKMTEYYQHSHIEDLRAITDSIDF